MFNLGSRAFFLLALVSGLAAVAVGTVSADRLSPTLLGTAAAVLVFLGMTALAATGPGERTAAMVGTQSAVAGRAPQASIAPLLLAGGAAAAGVGAVLGPVGYAAGAVLLVFGGLAWYVSSWREHPDYVPAATSRVSDRFSLPIGLPVAVLLLIAFIVISVSRLLLAVNEHESVAVAAATAVVILGCGSLMAFRPKLDRKLVVALVALAVALVAAIGIVGAAKGERKFEKPEKAVAKPGAATTATTAAATPAAVGY